VPRRVKAKASEEGHSCSSTFPHQRGGCTKYESVRATNHVPFKSEQEHGSMQMPEEGARYIIIPATPPSSMEEGAAWPGAQTSRDRLQPSTRSVQQDFNPPGKYESARKHLATAVIGHDRLIRGTKAYGVSHSVPSRTASRSPLYGQAP
jgi:hypothetical protein